MPNKFKQRFAQFESQLKEVQATERTEHSPYTGSSRQVSPIEEMARNCYGYGRWEAPYWCIGLEEGMSGTLKERIEAWQHLGEAGLSDCRLFHERIKDPRWHQEAGLQRTWRPLMLLLMTFLDRDSDKESLREYQVRQWGSRSYAGETCVIELFGLPAKDLQAGAAQRGEHFTDSQIDNIRQERIECIHKMMEKHRETLKLVVMYGCSGRKSFEAIAGRSLVCDEAFKHGSTLMVFVPHANERGRTNEDWKLLGKNLQAKRNNP
jgi:hypothetical protein